MIYGNKFLSEISTDQEMKNLLESMREDVLNENYDVLQESLKDKLSKFLDLFKKKQKEDKVKIGRSETVLKMDISRVKLSKKTITFDKPKQIEELNWYGFIIAIDKGLNLVDSRKLAIELLNKPYDADITEKDVEELEKRRSTMYPKIVFDPIQKQFKERLTYDTDYNTFIKEFDNLFKEETQKEMGLYSTKEFKNSDEVNEYISAIENVQKEITEMGQEFFDVANIIIEKIDDKLEQMEELDDGDEKYTDYNKYIKLCIDVLSDIFNALWKMQNNVSDYAVRAIKIEQANIKKLDYTGKIK